MHAKEQMQWMEKKELIEISRKYIDVFKKVIKDCLDVQKDERILIVTDKGNEQRRLAAIVSMGYYLAARDMELDATMIVQDAKIKGERSDDNTLIALQELGSNNVIILALSGKLGSIKALSNSFRSFIKENHHRFCSASNLGRLGEANYKDFISAVDVDYRKMQEKGRGIKRELDNSEELRITTDAGTDLKIELNNKAIPNTGDYRTPGSGGNIPAGEVYLAPKFKSANGKIVIDGSSTYRQGTQLIKEPIVLTVQRGEIIDIQGGDEANNLRKTLDWACNKAKHPWGVKRIGELGFGINPHAKIIGATIVDEKVMGTAHVGIGSNYWFGGTIYAIIHLDQVFKNPKIYIDNTLFKF